jgi:GrpB-like predicted nucleotidyltransferase (UPF0157 family)
MRKWYRKDMDDIGLKRGEVKLSEYNPRWAELFEEEKETLLEKFPSILLEISHGGSTSVPGLSAKPIIDMFAVVKSLSDAGLIRKDLEDFGYHYRGEEGVPERILFAKGPEEMRTYHLQLVERESGQWKNHILLREYYRRHPEVATEYEKLKLELAEKYPNDRKAYGAGKKEFIAKVLEKAREELEAGGSSSLTNM